MHPGMMSSLLIELNFPPHDIIYELVRRAAGEYGPEIGKVARIDLHARISVPEVSQVVAVLKLFIKTYRGNFFRREW